MSKRVSDILMTKPKTYRPAIRFPTFWLWRDGFGKGKPEEIDLGKVQHALKTTFHDAVVGEVLKELGHGQVVWTRAGVLARIPNRSVARKKG